MKERAEADNSNKLDVGNVLLGFEVNGRASVMARPSQMVQILYGN